MVGCLLAAAAGAATPEQGVKAPAPEPRISLRKGSDVEAILRTFQNSVGGVSVADGSALRPVLRRDLDDVPLSRALDGVSADLDRYWLRKGHALALQRRLTDPEEEPGLEIEELREVAADMYRLIRPFFSRLPDEQFIRNQNAFADSITPEQMRAMTQGGLPLTALPETQRKAFLQVMLDQAYSPSALNLERFAQCFAVWKQGELTDILAQGEKRMTLTLNFPDPAMSDGKGGCAIYLPITGTRSVPSQGDGREVLDPLPLAPKDLRPLWNLELQRVDLGALADRFQADGGPKLEVPAYARKRALWICSRGGSRAEVLSALELLWGWKLSPSKDGYSLARPQFAPARNVEELHARLLAAVPPSLFHPTATYFRGATDRITHQMELVFAEADRIAGKDWLHVQPAKLSELNQQRLANCIAMSQLQLWYTNHGKLTKPPAWLVHPEQGVFTLQEPIRQDNHPLLKFSVRRELGGPAHDWVEEAWGWYVNTSSLKK
jgi:hypothetical protein